MKGTKEMEQRKKQTANFATQKRFKEKIYMGTLQRLDQIVATKTNPNDQLTMR